MAGEKNTKPTDELEQSLILLIDDEPQNLQLLDRILTPTYQLAFATSGYQGLKVMGKVNPDLILLDIMMPQMDGFAFCQELQRDEKKRSIPVIFISALTELEHKIKGFTVGGVDYITKPFQAEEVKARVKNHLALKNAIQKEKEARRREHEANSLTEAIFKSIPDTIITVDREMQVIRSNKSLGQKSDNPSDICTHSIGEQLQAKSGSCFQILQKAIAKGMPITEYQTECSCKNYRNRSLLLSATPVESGSNFTGAVMVIRDITRLTELERSLKERKQYQNIIGRHEKMQQTYGLLDQVADLDLNVLILGESGTGKELIADAVHYGGNRAEKALIKVNCAALPDQLLESELFGHTKGAFTGAIKDRIGRVQAAEGGTLFLDEIGDLSIRMQVKLLRFLEQKEFERLGDSKTLKANVRVVCATNQNLDQRIAEGEFREDLYYRLRGVVIHLPPLRERLSDLPLLTDHFIDQFKNQYNKNVIGLSETVKRIFETYSWPGNIRELKSVIEYACAVSQSPMIGMNDLSPEFKTDLEKRSKGQNALLTEQSEEEAILNVLEQTDWNKAKAARILSISRATLYNKMRKYKLSRS